MQVTPIGSNVKDYGPITPSDTIDLAKMAIGFIVTGAAGTLAVTTPSGTDVTIPASVITVGAIIPLPVKRIKATGTTATGILAVYGS